MNRIVYRPTPTFIEGLDNYPEPRYRVAIKANIPPQTFYNLCAGIIPCRKDDARILAAGRIIGLEESACLERV